MRTVHVPLVVALAACAAAPPHENVPPVLQPFTEAAQFLAPGFQSYEFAIEDEPDFTSEVEHYLRVVIARSGSDFQKPKDLGAGRCRGVEVRDYGAVRVSVPWYEAGEPTEHIDGVPVWLGKGDGVRFDRSEPLWVAVVDARVHVSSQDRDLLEAALRRRGRLDEIVRPFAAIAFVPADAQRVLCLLPRPGDSAYWNRPIPIEPMVVAFCPEKRLLMFHRQPLPLEFRADPKNVVASRRIDDWTIDEQVMSPKDPEASVRLVSLHLFGLAIFL